MKFVFLGSGKIAESFLNLYCQNYSEKLALVGLVSPVDLLHQTFGRLPQPILPNFVELDMVKRKENELLELLRSTRPDFVLSVQYPWILSPEILCSCNWRFLNLHNARLPDYRGHNAISHEILNDETTHTVTLHWMASEVDRGKIAMVKNLDIMSDDTALSLWERSVDLAIKLLQEFLDDHIKIVSCPEGPEVSGGGCYYSKRSITVLKKIGFGASLKEIDRVSRAFYFPPHEPAYFQWENRRIYLLPNTFEYISKRGV